MLVRAGLGHDMDGRGQRVRLATDRPTAAQPRDANRARAEAEGRLGEIEGIGLTLSFLRDKRAEAHRVQQREPIHLGLPAVGSWNGS